MLAAYDGHAMWGLADHHDVVNGGGGGGATPSLRSSLPPRVRRDADVDPPSDAAEGDSVHERKGSWMSDHCG